jgi:hypothetical protein
MPKLKPFRDYSEHDVVNLYSLYGSAPINAGTLVQIYNDGVHSFQGLNNMSSFDNTISALFESVGKVKILENFDDTLPLGVLLKDVREYDENGEYLLHNPRKLAELDCVLPHQTVPVLTKGLIYVNDIDLESKVINAITYSAPTPEAGIAAYAGNNGKISTLGLTRVGTFMSALDPQGYALIRLTL